MAAASDSSAAGSSSTIFVRGLPPSITPHALSSLFSSVGPVKKADVLKTKNSSGKVDATSTGLGFGFVRFTCAEDASDAAREMSGVVTEIAGRKYKLQVEVAKPSGAAQPAAKPAGEERPPQTQEEQELGALKRTARVIVRNLSFYAKASHVRAALEGFGDIVELALPTVKTGDEMKGGKGKQQKSQHRGFAFVTFKTAAAAKAAVDRCAKEGGIEIRGRKVAVDVSVPKHMHEEGRRGERKAEAERGEAERGEAAGSGDDDDSDGDDGDDGDDGSDDSDDSESDGEDSASPKKGPKKESSSSAPAAPPKDASEKCTAFVRNVPFDVTDRDLFSLFKTYGAIAKVFVVLDPATGMGKGSAFVKFKYRAACERALEAARADETSPFVAAKAAAANVSSGNDGIMLNGRRLLVDLAVDRETAGGLKVERDENGKALKKAGKDRRNLYLKMEGYVNDESGGFANLPRQDQEKRQRAASEKNTKLRSPLFFINPLRLSIRNLHKDVDEVKLKKLVVDGIKGGLTAGLVGPEDVTAQLKAQGLPLRECVGECAEVPEFEDKNVKKYVPSLYIDREVVEATSGKKTVGVSRGYGFVEFAHHAHALACLRELNNNPKFSKQWVMNGQKVDKLVKAGGKGAGADFLGEDGKVKTPRLVVEFTIENKAKANEQAKRKEKVRENTLKQLKGGKGEDEGENAKKAKKGKKDAKDGKDGKDGKGEEKKKSRGQLQREKKRKAREAAERGEGGEQEEGGGRAEDSMETEAAERKPRGPQDDTRKAKKSKVKLDKTERAEVEEERTFDKLVDQYKRKFKGEGGGDGDEVKPEDLAAANEKKSKRWFD